MLIKIQFKTNSEKLSDNLLELPYSAMIAEEGHTIDWWMNGEKFPSHSYKSNTKVVRPLGYHDTITVLHRYITDGKPCEHSVLRHYRRIEQYDIHKGYVENIGYLVIDAKANFDIKGSPSLLSMLWLSPHKVRVEVECSWEATKACLPLPPINDEHLAIKEAKVAAGMDERTAITETQNEMVKLYLIATIQGTVKAIKRLRADLDLLGLSRRDKLEESRELSRLLLRTSLGKLLGHLAIEEIQLR